MSAAQAYSVQPQVMNDPTLLEGSPIASPLHHDLNPLFSGTHRSGGADANSLCVDPDLDLTPGLIPDLDGYFDFGEGLQQAGAPVASSLASHTVGSVPTSSARLQARIMVDDTLTLPEEEKVSTSAFLALLENESSVSGIAEISQDDLLTVEAMFSENPSGRLPPQ